jgi:predicted kinase
MNKLKLVITQGLPASGKSTWAAEQRGFVVVNRDSIRAMLGCKFSHKNEKLVRTIRDTSILAALDSGKSVIVSDTNLSEDVVEGLTKLAADSGAAVSIKSFMHVPIQVCVERDAARPAEQRVGARVILGMWEQWATHLGQPQAGTKAIIVDIDGTLARHVSRTPYEYDKVLQDEPIAHVVDIVSRMYETHIVIVMSGRPDSCRADTEQWLKQHKIGYDLLFMRDAKDSRKDYIVKTDLYEQYVKGKYMVDFVLDDRDQVVLTWRALGIPCLQCDYGNF